MDDMDHSQVTEIKNLSAENSRLDNECSELAMLLAKRELELAECRYRLKAVIKIYEDICNSRTWQITAPIRKFLDKITKSLCKADTVSQSGKDLALTIATLLGKTGSHWLDTVNGCKGKVAVLQGAFDYDDYLNERLVKLAEFLVENGYLVLFATVAGCGKNKLKNAVLEGNSRIIQLSNDELLNKIDQLQLQRDLSHICFISFPTRTLVEFLPSFRQAGFSIVVDLLGDWESSHEKGQAVWYEKASEEQAVLYSDLVEVASLSLKQKFSHLRKDILCIDERPSVDGDKFIDTAYRFEQLLSETTSKSYMRNIYA